MEILRVPKETHNSRCAVLKSSSGRAKVTSSDPGLWASMRSQTFWRTVEGCMLLRRRNSESDQCSGTNERTRIRRKGIKSDKKKSCSKKGIVRHPKAQHKKSGPWFQSPDARRSRFYLPALERFYEMVSGIKGEKLLKWDPSAVPWLCFQHPAHHKGHKSHKCIKVQPQMLGLTLGSWCLITPFFHIFLYHIVGFRASLGLYLHGLHAELCQL